MVNIDIDAFRLEVGRLAMKLDGKLVDRLKTALYVERPHLPKDWVLTAYTHKNSPGNDIEFVIEPSRVVDTPGDSVKFSNWLDAQANELDVMPVKNRTGKFPDSWRGGFTISNALELVRRWKDRYAPLVAERWPVELLQAGVLIASHQKNDELMHTIDEMVISARSAAAQSGQVQSATSKRKEVRFQSDAEFKDYVTALFHQQRGICRLSGLKMQQRTGKGDVEMQASLDRIDSNGHYERDNLQIVCRFINRWKRDDADENFRRLLQAVRHQGMDRC